MASEREFGRAVNHFRRATELKPGLAKAHFNLGSGLALQGDFDGALRSFRQVVELDPKLSKAHNNLGLILLCQGKVDEAIPHFRRAIDCDSQTPTSAHELGRSLDHLGTALALQGDFAGAIAQYSRAVKLAETTGLLNNLGVALARSGRGEESDHYYELAASRQSEQFAPPAAYINLGNSAVHKERWNEAVYNYRKAEDSKLPSRDPNLRLTASDNFAAALIAREQSDQSISAFRLTFDLRPQFVRPYFDQADAAWEDNIDVIRDRSWSVELGGGGYKEILDQAIERIRVNIDRNPNAAGAHNNLGVGLALTGDLEGANRSFRKSLILDPKMVEAQHNLREVVLLRGRYSAACDEIQIALKSLPSEDSFRSAVMAQLRRGERLRELNATLPSFLKGEANPEMALDAVMLAELCIKHKKLYAAAARLYAGAISLDQQLADAKQYRYNAACAAVLAAAGQGEDGSKLTTKEREGLRDQAMAWLRAELARWRGQRENTSKPDRSRIAEHLAHWLTDPDLDSVRSEEGLRNLPDNEREMWHQLWDYVYALLHLARQ